MSTIEVKDNSKMAVTQIKNIASSIAAYYNDRDESVRVLFKKKDRTSVLQKKHNLTTGRLSIMENSAIACFAKRREFFSEFFFA